LIDQQSRICYSNINKDTAEKLLEDFYITDYLPIDDPVSFNVGCYAVTADKVVLEEKIYYFILIQPHRNIYKYIYRDSVTGLYNKNYWQLLISGELRHSMPRKFTLIVIDIDDLKSINDYRGHLVGDKVIQIVGQCIRESIRKQDIAIRYGRDEFFIILANAKKDIAEKVINRIKENIRKKEREKILIFK